MLPVDPLDEIPSDEPIRSVEPDEVVKLPSPEITLVPIFKTPATVTDLPLLTVAFTSNVTVCELCMDTLLSAPGACVAVIYVEPVLLYCHVEALDQLPVAADRKSAVEISFSVVKLPDWYMMCQFLL